MMIVQNVNVNWISFWYCFECGATIHVSKKLTGQNYAYRIGDWKNKVDFDLIWVDFYYLCLNVLLKNNDMDIEVKDKANRRHVGHNLQKIRVYFGMKQEALAADLGVNQQVISKIEKQEEIEEGLLNQIASVLGISAEVIKDFDVEKAIYNINNIRDNTFEQGSTSIAQQFNPVDKIVELYERLLQSEREKVELLKNKWL